MTDQNDQDRPIRGGDLRALGLPEGRAFGDALRVLPRAVKRLGPVGALDELAAVVADPAAHLDHPYLAAVAERLVAAADADAFSERAAPAPFGVWCSAEETGAIEQLRNAARLPNAVRGALMPDAHYGYGLPIGGILATDNTVIPYAVGVDIACRMRLTVLDLDPAAIDESP